jgi:hypothetical protein
MNYEDIDVDFFDDNLETDWYNQQPQDEEDEDWFIKENEMINAEKVEKLTPLVKAHEEVLSQQADLRAQTAALAVKITALEKQRLASTSNIVAVLGDNETFVGENNTFSRLTGALYICTLVK